MKAEVKSTVVLGIVLLLLSRQPVFANGGHVHLGGIFFLLLGGIVFIGGLGAILYFLFRAEPEDAEDTVDEEDDDE